jgi:hypothetical protein
MGRAFISGRPREHAETDEDEATINSNVSMGCEVGAVLKITRGTTPIHQGRLTSARGPVDGAEAS